MMHFLLLYFVFRPSDMRELPLLVLSSIVLCFLLFTDSAPDWDVWTIRALVFIAFRIVFVLGDSFFGVIGRWVLQGDWSWTPDLVMMKRGLRLFLVMYTSWTILLILVSFLPHHTALAYDRFVVNKQRKKNTRNIRHFLTKTHFISSVSFFSIGRAWKVSDR